MLKPFLFALLGLALAPAAFAEARTFRCDRNVEVTVFDGSRIKVSLDSSRNAAYFLARRGANGNGVSYQDGQFTTYVPKKCMYNATQSCMIYINLDRDDIPGVGDAYDCLVMR